MINPEIENDPSWRNQPKPENRWDFARKLRNLDSKPIQNNFSYMGRLHVQWDKIYNDLKDKDWRRVDWFNWNWRVERYRNQLPFPQNESTKRINLNTVHFWDTQGFVDDDYPPFAQILDDLGLYMPHEDPHVDKRYRALKVNRQLPGDMLWMHYDLSGDDAWEQYIVFLSPWEVGQASFFGTEAITNWKIGDCYRIDTNTTPHGTVNCGPGERWAANIKGRAKPNRKFNFLTQ